MSDERKKISELNAYSGAIVGFYVIVTKDNAQGNPTSYKVSLDFIQTAADNANTKAGLANTAATNANEKASLANSAASSANTAAANANTKAGLADTAASNANAKASLADTAAASATSAAGTATTAAGTANTAAATANTAATNADTKATAANTAAAAATAAKEALQAYMNTFYPTGLSVTYPERITYGNQAELYVVPNLTPSGVQKNVLFISNNKAVSLSPSGRITVVALGISTIHVVPTHNTSIAKVIQIEVVAPVTRLVTATAFRFYGTGVMRMV